MRAYKLSFAARGRVIRFGVNRDAETFPSLALIGAVTPSISALGVSVFERDQSGAKEIARHENDRFMGMNAGPEDNFRALLRATWGQLNNRRDRAIRIHMHNIVVPAELRTSAHKNVAFRSSVGCLENLEISSVNVLEIANSVGRRVKVFQMGAIARG
jgi:hypothetical protein